MQYDGEGLVALHVCRVCKVGIFLQRESNSSDAVPNVTNDLHGQHLELNAGSSGKSPPELWIVLATTKL